MPTAGNEYSRALTSKVWQERQAAAEALGMEEAPLESGAKEALYALLDDHVYLVRHSAALALARHGSSDAAEALLQKLEEAGGGDKVNPMKQLMALEQLAFVPGSRSYRTLVQTLEQDDGMLSQAALTGLCLKQEPLALFDLQAMKKTGAAFSADYLSWAMTELKKPARKSLEFEKKDVVCAECLARFTRYKVKTGFFSSIAFYGCRVCGMTADRIEEVKKIIAVIDAPWQRPYRLEEGTLFVNMVMRPKDAPLVEFDLLEIHAAGEINHDDELGHILRRSGEDTYMNQARLKTLPVRLVGNPNLNQNSLNLLIMRFKDVIEK